MKRKSDNLLVVTTVFCNMAEFLFGNISEIGQFPKNINYSHICYYAFFITELKPLECFTYVIIYSQFKIKI